MGGLFGTRASLLVDLSLSVFVAMPVALVFAIRLARRRDLRRHRTAQIALFAVMTVAVILLETDIRLAGGTSALAGRAVALPGSIVRSLLFVHIAVATATWAGWVALLIVSSRRAASAPALPSLPGSFSKAHARLGIAVFAGNLFNAASGVVLYIAAFS